MKLKIGVTLTGICALILLGVGVLLLTQSVLPTSPQIFDVEAARIVGGALALLGVVALATLRHVRHVKS